MSLDEIGERAIIRRIREIVGEPSERTLLGIGDDAAVIDAGGRLLVLTTDAFTEWVHFRFDLISPDQVGEKALAATVSDCAAMGCAPRWVTVALSAPSELSIERVEEIYHGLARGARKYGCDLVGGDTVSSMSDVTLALSAVGEPFGGRILARSGAEVGDDVFVTGALGGPMAGLYLLQNAPELTLREEFHESVRRYLAPQARVVAARILATRFPVTSLIDVSDGLSVDIHHLARASGVGFVLERALIPAEPSALRIAEAFDESSDLLVLHGGEEFELLFTASPGEEDLVETVRAEAGLMVTRIGTVVDREEGIVLLDESGEAEPFEEIGYEHFGKRAGGAGKKDRSPEDEETGTKH